MSKPGLLVVVFEHAKLLAHTLVERFRSVKRTLIVRCCGTMVGDRTCAGHDSPATSAQRGGLHAECPPRRIAAICLPQRKHCLPLFWECTSIPSMTPSLASPETVQESYVCPRPKMHQPRKHTRNIRVAAIKSSTYLATLGRQDLCSLHNSILFFVGSAHLYPTSSESAEPRVRRNPSMIWWQDWRRWQRRQRVYGPWAFQG